MQSRNYNNFKTRVRRSQASRRRTQYTEEESWTNGQNLNKDTRHECRDSKR